MEEAIKRMDFSTVARLTMKESNQFHAVCLDTEPPIFYLNETSKAIISVVEEFNAYSNQVGVCWSPTETNASPFRRSVLTWFL